MVGHTFVQRARAKVQSKVWLGTYDLAPLHELIGTELIAFLSKPSKLWSHGALLSWSDSIKPMVGSDKVASWVADDRAVKFLEGVDYICSETVLV